MAAHHQETDHRNNFGLIRLVFAASVAVTHSFLFVDGTVRRDPLTQVFHTVSLADVAVDGFFLISGYLVTQSYFHSKSPAEYLGKRVLRIYPGYFAACVVSLGIGLAAAGTFPPISGETMFRAALAALFLAGVGLNHVFPSLAYSELNGSMWTLPYEFRCYFAVILLGLLGAFRSRRIFGVLTLAMIVGCVFWGSATAEGTSNWFFGGVAQNLRVSSLFLGGSAFYLFRDRIVYRGKIAFICLIATVACLGFGQLATPALTIFGGYSLFWFAFRGPGRAISEVLSRTDLSYGIYLYGWPVGMFLLWSHPGTPAWALSIFTLAISAGVAYLSWVWIEKPALKLKKYLTPEHGF